MASLVVGFEKSRRSRRSREARTRLVTHVQDMMMSLVYWLNWKGITTLNFSSIYFEWISETFQHAKFWEHNGWFGTLSSSFICTFATSFKNELCAETVIQRYRFGKILIKGKTRLHFSKTVLPSLFRIKINILLHKEQHLCCVHI